MSKITLQIHDWSIITKAMDRNSYEGLLSDEPLPDKYFISHVSLGSSDTESAKDDGDMKGACSSSDNNDASSVEFENFTQSGQVPRSGGWGSAESGLNYIGRTRAFDPHHDHGLYERRSEDRERGAEFSPHMPRRMTKVFASHSEKKPRRPAVPMWLPVNTQNILAKVRELLGTQSTRNKMTVMGEGQKVRKRLPLDAKRHEPMKAHHASPSPGKPPPGDLGLEAQVLFNLERKNRENTRELDDKSCGLDSEHDHSSRTDQTDNDLYLDDIVRPHTETEESNWNKGLSGLTFGSSRSSDTVPTAHVTPNLLNHHSTSNLHKFPSDEALHGRHITSSEHRNALLVPTDEGHPTAGLSNRWSSQHNMISDRNPDDFHFQALPSDSDMSILQTNSYSGNDDLNAYKHRGVAVGLPMRQTHYDGGSVPVARFPESARISSQSLLHSNQQGRDYPYSYPHDAHKETFRSGVTDRPYMYGQGTATSVYGAQNYSQDYSSSFAGSSPRNQFVSDFTSWEQKHQESLRKQQMEMSEPPGYVSSGGGPVYHVPGPQSVSNLLIGDPHKLDSVKRAADNIIREKDMIIERQKMKIVDLERGGYKEPESSLHKDLYLRSRDETDALTVRLQDVWSDIPCTQEYEYENLSLKRQLAEKGLGGNKSSQNNLEDKLGAAEHEVQRLRLLLKEETETKKTDLGKLIEKLKDKDNLIMDWKDKYSTLKKSQETLQKKLDGMERYFADLPTVEESSKKDKLMKSSQEDTIKYKQQVSDFEKKLSDARRGLSSRDALIKSLEDNVTDMDKKIEKVEARNKKLKDQLNQDGAGFDDIEKLEYENRKLKADLDKAKKLLETAQKKSQHTETRYRSEVSDLKERLSQEESAVVALREEMLSKEQHLKKLRQSFKEVSSQNQDLIDTNMSLKDRIKEADRQITGDIRKLEKRLMKELSVCFTELSNLVHVCVQRADGQDPNISVLLGIKAGTEEPEMELESADCLQSLKSKITKLRELRDEVDKLRELISNKYAEDMGENFNGCSTQ